MFFLEVYPSIHIVLSICENIGSFKIHDMVPFVIAHIVWVTWSGRNQTRSNNVFLSFGRGLHLISDVVSLSYHISTGVNSISIDEFCFLKYFFVLRHPPKA